MTDKQCSSIRQNLCIVDLGGGLRPHASATHNVDLYNETTREGMIFIKHDLNQLPLPFADNSVDRFIMDNVIEHLTISSELLFSDIFRCLKVYGTFLIRVPNTLFFIYRLEYLFGIIPKDFILFHRKHFTHTMVEYLLKNAGFKINTFKNWKSFIPFRNIVRNHIEFESYKIPG